MQVDRSQDSGLEQKEVKVPFRSWAPAVHLAQSASVLHWGKMMPVFHLPVPVTITPLGAIRSEGYSENNVDVPVSPKQIPRETIANLCSFLSKSFITGRQSNSNSSGISHSPIFPKLSFSQVSS